MENEQDSKRTRVFLDWARTQSWWEAVAGMLNIEPRLVVLVHAKIGPPADVIPPARREAVARAGGILFAGAIRKGGGGFAVIESTEVDPWALEAAPVDAMLGRPENEFLAQVWGNAIGGAAGEA